MQDSSNDVFVGSSSEFLKQHPDLVSTMESIFGEAKSLRYPLTVNLWEDWFDSHPGLETFQILDLAAKTTEWAILIFSQDDLRRTFGDAIEKSTVRDNVLFELGLFYGHIGTKKVFILEQVAQGVDVRVAGDISGIQRLRFSDIESLKGALRRVTKTIEERSSDFVARWAPASSLAIGYFEQAIKPFLEKRREQHASMGQFVVKILVPRQSLQGLDVPNIRYLFESAGCKQVDAKGGAEARPMLWAFEHQNDRYFDVPTTLLTAERVIESYMANNASFNERGRLSRSQARAFIEEVRRRSVVYPEVEIVEFVDVKDIGKYLKG